MGQIRKNQAKYAYRAGKVLDDGLPTWKQTSRPESSVDSLQFVIDFYN